MPDVNLSCIHVEARRQHSRGGLIFQCQFWLDVAIITDSIANRMAEHAFSEIMNVSEGSTQSRNNIDHPGTVGMISFAPQGNI